jgi:hypothetical protein
MRFMYIVRSAHPGPRRTVPLICRRYRPRSQLADRPPLEKMKCCPALAGLFSSPESSCRPFRTFDTMDGGHSVSLCSISANQCAVVIF